MAVDRGALERIGELVEVQKRVREAVQRIRAAQQPGGYSVTKQEALADLMEVTDEWLEQSGLVEGRLLGVALGAADQTRHTGLPAGSDQPSGDAGVEISTSADAVERLWAISLLHLAIAADLAALGAIDALDDEQLVSASPWIAAYPSAITAIAEDAQIGVLLPMPADQADATSELGGPPHLSAAPGPAAVDVLTELVNRANECTCAILVGIIPAPPTHLVVGAVTPLLHTALGATPTAITDAAARIAGLVMRLLRRVRDVMDAVKRNAFDFVKDQFIDQTTDIGTEHILGKAVRPVVATALHEKHITARISQERINRIRRNEPAPGAPTALARKTILKHNQRWIAKPVPRAARVVLRPLQHVAWSGVPAAPIAACLMLAWTLLLTGDEIDIANWPFPDFYQPGLASLPS